MVAPTLIDTYDEDPVNVDEFVGIDEEEDDLEIKDHLLRVLGVFFMRMDHGDMNHVNEFGKATPAFSIHTQCVQKIHVIGEAVAITGIKLTPSILKQYGIN